MITAGELLRRVLAVRGVDAVYGDPLAGVPVVPVRDGAVARLLPFAHGRVHRAPAASCTGGVVAIGGPEVVITDAGQLLDLGPDPVSLRLEIDLDGPAPDRLPTGCPPPDPWGEPAEATLACVVAAQAPAVLAGPGVVGSVGGLGALAAAGNVGVLNTWGAKGVFHWRSRHHWATVGLQADDFRLGGFSSADLIVATGVDEDEAAPERWQLAPVVTVEPGELAPLSERWHRPPTDIGVPPSGPGWRPSPRTAGRHRRSPWHRPG